jgi:hypothetical protein
MSTRGVKRYLSCLDYLEAKYSTEIDEEEYNRRKQSYAAFDNTAPPRASTELSAEDAAEPADEIGDDDETDTDDDSKGSLADFIEDDEVEDVDEDEISE